MQLINKESVKVTFTHTWYLYPLLIALSSLVWMWGFQAFHQPSAHQKLVMFFASEVKKNSFANKIMNDHYDRETLRQVDLFYGLPNSAGYRQKVNIYLNSSDILVLDEGTLSELNEREGTFFVSMNDYIKEYVPTSVTYYSKDAKDYGIRVKEKNVTSPLSEYMTFDESKDYYLFLSVTSKNLGKYYDENNEKYDNALTYMRYLLTEYL